MRNNNKIQIAKFVKERIENQSKIVGGEGDLPGGGGDPGTDPGGGGSCPIACQCIYTQSNGCINGSGNQTGPGN